MKDERSSNKQTVYPDSTTATATVSTTATTSSTMAPLNPKDAFLCHETSTELAESSESASKNSSANNNNNNTTQQLVKKSYEPPLPPQELPLRFLRAGKNDPIEGQRRYEQTLAWRQEHDMDHIIKRPHPKFDFIKQHYPQYFHLRGRKNELVWYEKPPAVNLKALLEGGVGVTPLLDHYAMVTEFGWQVLETDDLARAITVLDMEGIRIADFVGEVVDFTRKCSANTGDHYPERAGYVFVINVPLWFNVIWKVVKSFVDEVTLKKIKIVRGSKAIKKALAERIPLENIPPIYGGTSMPLGQSPEEEQLTAFVHHNNALAAAEASNLPKPCCGTEGDKPCAYCTWVPVRSY